MNTTMACCVKRCYGYESVGNTWPACEYHRFSLTTYGIDRRVTPREHVFLPAPKNYSRHELCLELSAHWDTPYGFCTHCGDCFVFEPDLVHRHMGLCDKCAGDAVRAYMRKARGAPDPFLEPEEYACHKALVDQHNERFFKKKSITTKMRLKVFERDGYACLHCGSNRDLRVDHIIPESKGGAHEIENFQTLCARCNSKKGVKMPEDMAQ